MQDELTQKLNTIVGAALRGLVESGASDEALGRFAASHRQTVSQILGLQPQEAREPDLVSVVEMAVRRVLGVAQTPGQSAAPTVVRRTVTVGGKRTTVSLNKAVVDELIQKVPKPRQLLDSLAAGTPPDASNRSSWLETRLRAYLTTLAAAPPPADQAH